MKTLAINGKEISYSKTKNGLLLYSNRELIAFIKKGNNAENPFIVSAHRLENGSIRYMFSIRDIDAIALGIDNLGYMEETRWCEDILEKVNN